MSTTIEHDEGQTKADRADQDMYCEHDHLADACEDCALERFRSMQTDPDAPADAPRRTAKPRPRQP